PARPGDHDRTALRCRPDRVALRVGVRVPVTRVSGPRYVALGRHVVRAPANRELVVYVGPEAASHDLVRVAGRGAAAKDLVERWRWRERACDATGDGEG